MTFLSDNNLTLLANDTASASSDLLLHTSEMPPHQLLPTTPNLTDIFRVFCAPAPPRAADLRAAAEQCTRAHRACPEVSTPPCVADMHAALEQNGDLAYVFERSCEDRVRDGQAEEAVYYSLYETLECLVGLAEEEGDLGEDGE